MRWFILPLMLTCCAWAPPSADAHFIWIVQAEGATSQAEGQVYFSESPSPGQGWLIEKVEQTQAWAVDVQGNHHKLELAPVISGETGALAASLGSTRATRLEAICDYGVFTRGDEPMRLYYYAKHLTDCCSEDFSAASGSEKLALDVVPQKTDSGAWLVVSWHGQPAVDAEVVVSAPGAEPLDLTTDADGKVPVDLSKHGTYAARARWVEKENAGEKDGEAYAATLHYATLVMHLGKDKESEKPTAASILDEARMARAVWSDFPGFRARICANVYGHSGEGFVNVSPDGEVTLEGFGSLDTAPISQQLESMVMHRLSSGDASDTVEVVHEEVDHPLGTLLRLPDDAAMSSAYRVHGDVITEVNRDMGESRFTISVLDVHRNAEGKYLPRAYTVGFWNKETEALERVDTHYDAWIRIGKYDLPSRMTVLESTSSGNRMLALRFNDHQLLIPQGARETAEARASEAAAR